MLVEIQSADGYEFHSKIARESEIQPKEYGTGSPRSVIGLHSFPCRTGLFRISYRARRNGEYDVRRKQIQKVESRLTSLQLEETRPGEKAILYRTRRKVYFFRIWETCP